MYSTSNNVTITGASSLISTRMSGAITATSTSLTLTSATNFPSSGTVTLRINTDDVNEIISGTISGTTVSSLTRGVGGTDAAAHLDNSLVHLYQINGVPLTEINATHTAIANIGVDSYCLLYTSDAADE